MIDGHWDPLLFAIPVFFILLFLETKAIVRLRAAGRDVVGFETHDSRASLGMGAVSLLLVGLINFGVFLTAEWLWKWRVTDLGTGLAGWAIAMLAWDFAYYWNHRWEHEIRLLWAAHVNHHSSERYNFTTALRQPWTPFSSLVLYPPLALIGVRPWLIMIVGSCNLIYQFWVHTEAIDRMPTWFEFVLNTPSHHRVHHGSNSQYLDKNYAGILIVWDRIFRSFEPERERVIYGLTKNIHTYNLFTIAFHEYTAMWRDFRHATSIRNRFRAVFGPPGTLSRQ